MRDRLAIQRDVRVEGFVDRPVMLDSVRWNVASLQVKPGPKPTLSGLKLSLLPRDSDESSCWKKNVSTADMRRVRFPTTDGDYKIGPVKHGIMRRLPTVSRSKKQLKFRSGFRFEARL